MKLYKNIRQRRLALGMTQSDLARKLGYKSISTIAKIESGVNDIPQSKIIAFAEALNTTPGRLLGEVEDPAPAPAIILSLQEQQLLDKFRKLDVVNQEEIMDYVQMRLNKYEKSAKKGEKHFG